MSRHALLLAPLLLAAPLAWAQQAGQVPGPATVPAPARSAAAPAPVATALARQNAEMGQVALKVAQMVDANQLGPLWDGASVVAKKAVTRDAFVRQVGAERARLGALAGRGGASVTRVKYGPGAQVPEGLYVNVSFPTRFANAAQPVRELVSFRLDEDRVWRVSGYSLRMPN